MKKYIIRLALFGLASILTFAILFLIERNQLDIALSTSGQAALQQNAPNKKQKMEILKPLPPEELKRLLEFNRRLRKQAQDFYNSPGADVVNFQLAEKDEPQTMQEISEERMRLVLSNLSF